MVDSVRVTGLTKRLVLKLLGSDSGATTWDSKYNGHLNYALRILGSRMSPTVVQDEFHLCETIKTNITSQQQGDANDVTRFEELFNSLVNINTIVTHKWAIVYLLHSLSNTDTSGKLGQQSHTPLPIINPINNRGKSSFSSVNDNKPSNSNTNRTQQPIVDPQTAANHALIQQNLAFEVPEDILLRDIIFTFQGVNGKFIKYNEQLGGYAVKFVLFIYLVHESLSIHNSNLFIL